jgi:predicted  nucleic acid-binding Zn-ribbon protein
LSNLQTELETAITSQTEYNSKLLELENTISNLEKEMEDIESFEGMFYDSEKDIWDHENNIKNLAELLEQEIN